MDAVCDRSRTQRALPVFVESQNAELNQTLAEFRTKCLIPAYLQPRERKLITSYKFKQSLEDNPQVAMMGNEEIRLSHLDLRHDMPSRNGLISKALNIILSKKSKDWDNLFPLMEGIKDGFRQPMNKNLMLKVIRKAVELDKMNVVIQCLRQSERTGMSLKDPDILDAVLNGLHHTAEAAGWTQEASIKALKSVNTIARMLETKEHGSGSFFSGKNDARARPDLLALFLEFATVYSRRNPFEVETENLILSLSGRLLDRLKQTGAQPDIELVTKGAQTDLLKAIRIWNGLFLAQKVLLVRMPSPEFAAKVTANYEAAIEKAVAELEARNPGEGTWDRTALSAWRNCVRE